MPDVAWNDSVWGGHYDWSLAGEEWSGLWGGSEPQWYGSLLPRLHRMLPAPRLLEIAPGFGRWTRFLLGATSDYLGIDLAANCVAHCQERFASMAHARFEQNDGYSLEAVRDDSIDLIFSFDSLVHAELDVFEAYIPQMVRKLAPGGRAFLHHSNSAAFTVLPGWDGHARSDSVSAQRVSDVVERASGRVLIQEVIDWNGSGPIDCLTTFGRADENAPATPVRMLNMQFTEEARLISRYQQPYSNLRLVR